MSTITRQSAVTAIRTGDRAVLTVRAEADPVDGVVTLVICDTDAHGLFDDLDLTPAAARRLAEGILAAAEDADH